MLRDYGVTDTKNVGISVAPAGWNVTVTRLRSTAHIQLIRDAPTAIRLQIIRGLGLAR